MARVGVRVRSAGMRDRRSIAARAAALALAGAVYAIPEAADAHTYGAHGAGFTAGIGHPFGGLDHVLAMVAVGLWAAQIGGRALVVLPAAFVAVMALGGVVGAATGAPAIVELGIAGSVMVLGLLVARAAKPSAAIGMAIVATFAVFHGLAHGVELPQAASPWTYALGFVVATAALHAVGVGLGRVMESWAVVTLRWGGGAIAAVGAVLLVL